MKYPKILIIAIGRINLIDTANNGLLLRNLFGNWPKDNMAQIYSSGSNGDIGFFAHYYQLGPKERHLGRMFYTIKINDQNPVKKQSLSPNLLHNKLSIISKFKNLLKRIIIDTGLYEFIFRPRLSTKILSWVKEFQPDIIFAQGYNLTFTWLPVMLKERLDLSLIYYPTDDWPVDLYINKGRFNPLITPLIRRAVSSASKRIVEKASLRIAFNRFMQEEYVKRYKKEFTILMHGDSISRFKSLVPVRHAASNEIWIVSTGAFDEHRYPLLFDLDKACGILKEKEYNLKTTIFPVNTIDELLPSGNSFKHIDFEPCPSHDKLAAILKGADILFLPERFDSSSEDIRLCVSSKAHLFMFSEKPIIVYSSQKTGIARYATEEGWAIVAEKQDPKVLAKDIEKLILDKVYCNLLIEKANTTSQKNHDLLSIQDTFKELVCSVVNK